MRRGKQLPTTSGAGELRYSGFAGDVDYLISGNAATMTARTSPLRGSLTAEPEIAEAAFKAREGYLKLEDGKACRITMLGYTAGSPTAYFEIRV